MASPISDLASFVSDARVIGGGAIALIYGSWRWVLNPYIVTPIKAFFKIVREAIAAINQIQPDVATMKAALGPNGGRSLADVIHRTAGRVNLMLDSHSTPTWEASTLGWNTRVNPAYEMLLGYSAADLRGHGWKNILHPDDAEDYIDAWESAVRDVRPFKYGPVRFVTRDGRVLVVMVTASPTPLGVDTNSHLWMGSVLQTGPR